MIGSVRAKTKRRLPEDPKGKAPENFVDRVHFSKAGAKRMAENIAPFIEKILNQATIPSHTSDV